MFYSSMDTIFMRQCTTHLGLPWFANIWTVVLTLNTSSGKGSRQEFTGSRMNSKRWLSLSFQPCLTCNQWVSATETWSQRTCSSRQQMGKSRSSISESPKTTSKRLMMAEWAPWQQSEVHLSICHLYYGKLMLKTGATPAMSLITSLNQMFSQLVLFSSNWLRWKMLQDLIRKIKLTMVRS